MGELEPELGRLLLELRSDEREDRLTAHEELRQYFEAAGGLVAGDAEPAAAIARLEAVWEHFFVAVWSADKAPLQRLVGFECCRTHCFVPPRFFRAWCDAFWRVVMARWMGLDIHRVAKFYLFTRMFVAECLSVARVSGWGDAERGLDVFLATLFAGPLRPFRPLESGDKAKKRVHERMRDVFVNQGLGYHIIDVVAEELEVVAADPRPGPSHGSGSDCAGDVDSFRHVTPWRPCAPAAAPFLKVLRPILQIAARSPIAAAGKRVRDFTVPAILASKALASPELRLVENTAEILFFEAATAPAGVIVHAEAAYGTIAKIDAWLADQRRSADYDAVQKYLASTRPVQPPQKSVQEMAAEAERVERGVKIQQSKRRREQSKAKSERRWNTVRVVYKTRRKHIVKRIPRARVLGLKRTQSRA